MVTRLALLMALGSASLSCTARLVPAAPVVTASGVQFVMADAEALSVAVTGSFNGWSASSHPLLREKRSGVWSGIVALPPGEYQFMFVVNGTRFVSPPFAESYADDGFGARNGIVVVRPKE